MTNMDSKKVFIYHQKNRGKIETKVSSPIRNKLDLSLAYTPGVAEISKAISRDSSLAYKYTIKPHTVAIVSDGSAVLGLGNIGPLGALPVMEGKAALFKTFGGVDAFPICLNTQDTNKIIETVKLISPVFGGINLEDISAPRCFEIENSLQDLGIPVMHDDQHGTAVVVLAGLINAVKVVGKKMQNLNVVINGAGAAGNAIANLLNGLVKSIIVLDSKGIICKKRKDLDKYKKRLLTFTNPKNISGDVKTALIGSDVFIGVSKAEILNSDHIRLMAKDSIVFALANPIPEIMPNEAINGGAKVVATGRSDLGNQINNSLAFPGIFKGALKIGAKHISRDMKMSAAIALSKLIKKPTADKIIPGPFDENVADTVAKAVINSYTKQH